MGKDDKAAIYNKSKTMVEEKTYQVRNNWSLFHTWKSTFRNWHGLDSSTTQNMTLSHHQH